MKMAGESENGPGGPKKPEKSAKNEEIVVKKAVIPDWLDQGFRSSMAGFISGAGCMIAGHPLDTVKVRMQMKGKPVV